MLPELTLGCPDCGTTLSRGEVREDYEMYHCGLCGRRVRITVMALDDDG